MATFSIKIEGLEAALEKLSPAMYKRSVNDAFNAFGLATVKDAKINVPKDEGNLARSINFEKIDYGVQINVNADYAAYVEFGTRKFAESYISQLPNDWKTFAAEFKGKTGGDNSFMSFFYKILKWVQRKGFAADKTKSGKRSNSKNSIQKEYDAAYFIAISILRNGIKPQPYLYPAFEKNKPQLIKDLETI